MFEFIIWEKIIKMKFRNNVFFLNLFIIVIIIIILYFANRLKFKWSQKNKKAWIINKNIVQKVENMCIRKHLFSLIKKNLNIPKKKNISLHWK